jgi:type I restriction enzyme, S subunit
MSFPRYPAYKDSGVEWLGEVPEHWEVKSVRRIFKIKKRISGELGFDILSITQQGIKVRDPDSNDGQVSMDYSKYQIVEPGDFAMNHMDLLTGFVDISTSLGVTSPDYRVFSIAEPGGSCPGYLLYIFQMGYKQKILYAYGQGSSQLGRWRLPTEQFQDWAIPFPSLEEQISIATFLDRETAKIDALIAEQQRLIELLQEKRQAVISHAVTKGLNPDAPMKDSGVEWLGEVPEHWEVTRLGWIAEQVNDINHEMPEAVSEGVPFLSAKDLDDNGRLNFSEDVKLISREDFNRLSRKIKPETGDIVYTRIGTIGRAALVSADKEFLVSYSCCIIRVRKPQVNICFLRNLLASDLILTESKARTRSMGQPDLGLGEIRRFPLPLPPLKEQEKIEEYLFEEIGCIEQVHGQTLDCLKLLKERRSALISAAVTGQIDVRGLVPEAAEQ